MALHCYDALMDAADDDFAWPSFDENTASALCYTSGTTGRPKGVLYSHRSTVLHAYAISLPDVLCLRAVGPRPAGGADVPRQRLGHPVRRGARPAPRWCCPAGTSTAPACTRC